MARTQSSFHKRSRRACKQLEGRLIPDSLLTNISRNYGETANDKANELLLHLGLATVSIVILIGFAIGIREATVTAFVIPTTILLTLFASNLMGYTINRVSLFALIFSIGILVDDAIVVIENIARHWAMNDGRSRNQAAIEAVAEVGNPTIVATLTVIAALLPMMFVSGLMGPYMAPIPANASAAMVFSFFVAMILAPWLMVRFARKAMAHGNGGHHHGEGQLGRLYRYVAAPIIRSRATRADVPVCGRRRDPACLRPVRDEDGAREAVAIRQQVGAAGCGRSAGRRHSPGDGARADRCGGDRRAGSRSRGVDAYAGTASPFNFNGLVRHYYLRDNPEQGDLQVTLAPKDKRSRASHPIALDMRQRLKALTLPEGAVVRVVEVPPGPPVIATLLAEIYGPDANTRRAVASEVRKIFHSIPYIVDTDDSFGEPRPRLRLEPDRAQEDFFGVSEGDVTDSIAVALERRSDRIFAPRNRAQSDRDRGAPAAIGAHLVAGSGRDAGGGRGERLASPRDG